MRNQTTALMAFALAFGIGLSAAQTPSSSPASQPSTPAQAPAASPQSQAAPPAAAHQRDPVAEALNLTDDQQAKLQPIIQEEMTQINAARNDTSMTQEQKQQKIDQIRQTEFPKIQEILTPDQRKKLADMQEQARQHSNNPAAAPNNAPPQPHQ